MNKLFEFKFFVEDAKGKKVTYKLGMEAPEYFLAVAHLVRLLNKYYQEDLGNNEVRNSYTIISGVEVPYNEILRYQNATGWYKIKIVQDTMDDKPLKSTLIIFCDPNTIANNIVAEYEQDTVTVDGLSPLTWLELVSTTTQVISAFEPEQVVEDED